MSARMHMRKFDHDEARRRYKAGERLVDLAAAFGVTPTAVKFAVDTHARLRNVLLTAERQQSGKCIDCGAPCCYNPYSKRYRGRCRACAAEERATSVRDTELRCGRCREWLPDFAFPHSRVNQHRRGRHTICTPCQTIMRTAYRERHKVPCVQCGAPRLPGSEKGRNRTDSGLCLACYRASRSKAVTA